MLKGFFAGSVLAASKQPPSKVARCGECGLYKLCRSPKMPHSGDGGRRMLVVAEAPGAEEDARGIQLIGEAGQLLRRHMKTYGMDLDKDCWKTNANICRPPKNATPTDKQIAACRPILIKTIEQLQPNIIVLLGGNAVKSLMGWLWKEEVGPIGRWVGWQIPNQKLNCWICPTYHPSYLVRTKDKALEVHFAKHLKAIGELKGAPYRREPSEDLGSRVKVILDTDRAAALIRRFTALGGLCAFDYEANMLKPDPDNANIVCCSICWRGEKTIAYPWHGDAIEATREFLLAKNVRKIASNMKFEERWTMKHLGIKVRSWEWDTMVAAHVLDPRKGITSLKFQSFIHFGIEPYNRHIEPMLKATRKGVNRINDIKLDDLLLYCGIDSLLEYRLAVKQMAQMGIDL